MRLLSRVGVPVAKHLPRGSWPLARWLALRDPSLQDLEVPLRGWPGRSIRADLRESVFMHVFRNGCLAHQRGEELWIRKLVRRDDIVFDVGANVGMLTLPFAELVGPSGMVHAFEPCRKAARFLERSIGPADPVRIVKCAVSNACETVRFHETSHINLSSIDSPKGPVQTVATYEVEAITLDSYSASTGALPDFIKIDVEAHEPEVLEGASTILATRAPTLLFEALDREHLQRSIDVIRRANPRYAVGRITHQGELVDVDAAGCNNYLSTVDPVRLSEHASRPRGTDAMQGLRA